jgi:hypothetical protein
MSGLSPCLYKREVQGHPEGVRAREAADELRVSPSLTRRACNPYCERHPWCRIIQGLSHLLCSIPRQPISAGTRSDFTGRSKGPPGSETPTVGAPRRGLLRVNEHLPVEIQMGSLQQPLQPGTVLRFGSLEFMSLDGSYDMVLLPPRRDDNDGLRLARWRQALRQHLPAAEEEHSGRPCHPPRRRRRRRGNHGHAGGGTLSAVAPERVDDAGTPPGDMSDIVLAPKTTAGVTSPRRVSPKRTDDASTLAKDMLGVTLVPEMTVCSAPDATSPPSIDQEVPSVFHPTPFWFSFDPPSDPAMVSAFVKAYPNLSGYHMWST